MNHHLCECFWVPHPQQFTQQLEAVQRHLADTGKFCHLTSIARPCGGRLGRLDKGEKRVHQCQQGHLLSRSQH